MGFNLQQVTYSSERIDDFKKTYFVVNSLDESFTAPRAVLNRNNVIHHRRSDWLEGANIRG